MQQSAHFLWVLLWIVTKFTSGSETPSTTQLLRYQEQCTYTCKSGFQMTSSSYPACRICTASETFIGPGFSCNVNTCKTNLAPKMDNAVHNGTKVTYTHGMYLAYKCQEGYSDSLNRTSLYVYCSNKWRYVYTHTKLNCTEVRCGMPPNINHAEYFNLVHLTDTNITNTNMATTTNTTMTTETDTTMTTETDTTMTTATDTTINPTRESSTSIPSNSAEFWLYNATVQYECIQGFVPISSSNMSRCLQNSSWSFINLICVEQSITTIITTPVQNFPGLLHTPDSSDSSNNTTLSDITSSSNNTEAFTSTLMISSWDTTYDSQLITLSPSSLSQDNTIDYTSIVSSHTNKVVSAVSVRTTVTSTDVSSKQSSNITMTITYSGSDDMIASTDSFSYVSSTSISDHISGSSTSTNIHEPSTYASSNSGVTSKWANLQSTYSSSNSGVTPDMTNEPSTDLPYNSASTPDWNPVHPDYICIQYAKINMTSPPITPEKTYAQKLNIVKKFKPTVHEATHSLFIGSIVLLSMGLFLGFICILDCPRVGHPNKISSNGFTSNS